MTAVAPGGRPPGTRGAWLTPSPKPFMRRRDRRTGGPSVITLVFVVGLCAVLVGLAITMQTTAYDTWGAFLIGVILLILTIPLATRAAKRENEPRVGRIILGAALVKLTIGSISRYIMAYDVYKQGDSEAYFLAGRTLAPHFRDGDFGNLGSIVGTRFIDILSGITIAIVDETRLGLFVVFSWFAFVGLYCFYQAFRVGFPDGDHRRYRLLLFFWPTIVFWPSSLGKDAWMVMMLGMCALGVANLMVGRWRGFAWLGAGTAGCLLVRPHLAILVFSGIAVALVLRRNRGRYNRLLAKPTGTALLMVAALVASMVLVAQAQSFFELDALDFESAQNLLAETSAQTQDAGSAYTPIDPQSPAGYATAVVTVLFRPFPFEVSSGVGAVAGLEGVLLGILVLVSLRRLVRVPRLIFRNAYVAFAFTYTAAFIFAFSALSNFGVLARERSQLFPVLFVLFALPKAKAATEGDDDEVTAAEPVAAVR